MIVQRGFKQPPSYHIDRLRQVGVGHFFDVMTNGYGAMWKYSAQIEPRDRWAIAAYIRVLQASQDTNVNDLPADERSKLPGRRRPRLPMTRLRPDGYADSRHGDWRSTNDSDCSS